MKDKAVEICSRKVHGKYGNYFLSCRDCYYHDGKCELNNQAENGICDEYMSDVVWSNIVRNKILKDKCWCKEHFDMFCRVDKELFVTIHGDD